MAIYSNGRHNPVFSRRQLLQSAAAGCPMLAASGLLAGEKLIDANPNAPRAGHHPARAKRAIFLFMGGGPSHVDLFDPKPELEKHKNIPIELPRITRNAKPNCQPSPFKFAQHGDCGAWVSELLPHTASIVDDLCFIKSLTCDNIAHGAAIRQMLTGDDVFSRPSIGSWLLYGLGSENEDLPGFISIGRQNNLPGATMYSSSFLPAVYQGTSIENLKTPIANIKANVPGNVLKQKVAAIAKINKLYADGREEDTRLSARIAAYELALRMQDAAPKAFDISQESKATWKLYGAESGPTADYGKTCLLARRLVERGVRFVIANVDHAWDDHGQVMGHKADALATDRPVAALITDLKARGLLDDTLVIWGGEFGRTPTAEGKGRDHHPYAFTMWMAGGGVRPGHTFGKTDEFGYYPVENKVHVHDLHATILHLMGIDHERLTYRFSGRDFRLTDVHGHVIKDILA